MKKIGNLTQYDLLLHVKGPVFIGTGDKLSKVEYCYYPERNIIAVLDEERFADYLIKHNLIDAYERFMGSASRMSRVNLQRDFFAPNRISEQDVESFTQYSIRTENALRVEHSLQEVHLFMRDSSQRPYVPGSSIKGALRTVLLTSMILNKPWNDDISARNAAQNLETYYLNTLGTTRNSRDATNCIMRGLEISDSEPLGQKDMVLCKKEDLLCGNTEEIKSLPIIRECAAPGTVIKCSLTVDHSFAALAKWDCDYLLDCMSNFGNYYWNTYMSQFRAYSGDTFDENEPILFLGGGSGYFSKNVVYPNKQGKENEAVQIVSGNMQKSFRRHGHDKDSDRGISPHMLKTTTCDNVGMMFGLCSAELQ